MPFGDGCERLGCAEVFPPRGWKKNRMRRQRWEETVVVSRRTRIGKK